MIQMGGNLMVGTELMQVIAAEYQLGDPIEETFLFTQSVTLVQRRGVGKMQYFV
jgi:hypothetical protein